MGEGSDSAKLDNDRAMEIRPTFQYRQKYGTCTTSLPRGVHFHVMTGDGETSIATVAQDGDKAIHTPAENSILGRYFRRRLGRVY